jgi:hypothetical protein
MIGTCKMIAGMAIAALALTVVMAPNSAFGQKGDKGKDKKPADPKAQFEHSLDNALHRLKDAEKAVIGADVKELNLAQFNPAVSQKLIAAAQAINHAYELTQQAKSMSNTIAAPKKDNKKPPKGK